MPDILLDREFQPNESSGATSQAPQSRLSASQIAQPGEMMSKALDKVGAELESGSKELEQGAVTAAERQAYTDLAKQKITRDQNGNIQVLNQANSVFWGQAGRRYQEIARQGTSAQAGLLLNQGMVEDAARNPLNPAGFQAATDARLDKFQEQFGDTTWGAEALLKGREHQIQHADWITNRAAENDMQNQRISIESRIAGEKDTLIGLARGGGVDSPDFKKEWGNYLSDTTSLASNPLYKKPKDLVDLEVKQTLSLMQGEAIVQHIDETYNKQGKAEAQKVAEDQILKNPNLKESDRTRLYSQTISRLAYLSNDQRAGFEADKETLSYLRKGIAEGTIPADGPLVNIARERFANNHSTEAVKDLDAIIKAYPHVQTAQSYPGGAAAFFESRMGGAALHTEGMNPEFAGRLSQAVSAAEAATGEKAQFTSLVRDTQTQARLYWNYEHGIGGLAAPPGHSLHEKGEAADLKAGKTLDWLHAHAGEFGLEFLPGHAGQIDPGHIQIAGNLRGGAVPPGSPFMNDVAQIETGNRNVFSGTDHDYPGQPGSRSQGFFQIDVPTWGQFAGRAGVDTKQYPTPMNATREIQERVAAVIPLSRFGARTREMLMAKYGQLDTGQTLGQLAAGRQPAAPAADGGPAFTAADVDANPWLLSEAVRAQAADREDKTAHISALVSSMKETVKGGNMPDENGLATVAQAAQRDPGKYGMFADDVAAIKSAAYAIGGPGVDGRPGGGPMSAAAREQYEQNLQADINGTDLHHQKIANEALAIMKAQDARAAESPLTAYAQRFHEPAPPPIDPARPNDIGAVMAQRGVLAQHLGEKNGTGPFPLLEKGDGAKLQGAFQGPAGAKVVSDIMASIRPQDMTSLAGETDFRDGLLGMAHSGDPAKMGSAFAALGQFEKQNPFAFGPKFGKEVEAELDAWQKQLAYQPDAKKVAEALQPQPEEVRKSNEAAREILKGISAEAVLAKFNTGWRLLPGLTGTTAQPPIGTPDQPAPMFALKSDYNDAYEQQFALTHDKGIADSFATKQIAIKWGASEIGGGRVMAFPPERYYPQIDGSFDWAKKQVDDQLASALKIPWDKREAVRQGRITAPGLESESYLYSAPHVLISDTTTESDIHGGMGPSYQIAVQTPNGQWESFTNKEGKALRIFLDPRGELGAAMRNEEARGASALEMRRGMHSGAAGDFGPMSLPGGPIQFPGGQ